MHRSITSAHKRSRLSRDQRDSDDEGGTFNEKVIDEATKARTYYWEEVEEEHELFIYVTSSTSYNQVQKELSLMTVALTAALVQKEQLEIGDFWNTEEGLPGRFNRDRVYQDRGGEMQVVAIRAADPDVPHSISAKDVVSSVLSATGVAIQLEDFQIKRMENSHTPTWKLSTRNGDLADGLLATGGGLMNYEEYYFTTWIDFSDPRFVVNAKGIPIQVKPRELATLIEEYAGVKVVDVEFAKKKGIYQNYVKVTCRSEEDRKFLVDCSPAPLLAGLPGVRFQIPATAVQIQKHNQSHWCSRPSIPQWQEARDNKASQSATRKAEQEARKLRSRTATAQRRQAIKNKEREAKARKEAIQRRIAGRLQHRSSSSGRSSPTSPQ